MNYDYYKKYITPHYDDEQNESWCVFIKILVPTGKKWIFKEKIKLIAQYPRLDLARQAFPKAEIW